MSRSESSPTPALLIWARETAGYDGEIAAKKAGITLDTLRSWERGAERPTFAQLRKLAELYKRPLAVFYLPDAPKKFDVLRDFRRNRTQSVVQESPELTQEVRKAHDRREWALELFAGLDQKPPEVRVKVSIDGGAERAAATVRDFLGITLKRQSAWRTDYEAFREWRQLIEDRGILTFQATKISTNEARGFSIGALVLPVAVANIKDAPRGRIFTLLHELTHILLRMNALCDLHESDDSESSRIEAFCNHVAGAVLFPKDALLENSVVRAHRRGDIKWTDAELMALSRAFGGSREAALVRLLNLGLTTNAYYHEKREEFLKLYAAQREKQEGFAPPLDVALSSAGPTFTGLVVENLNREKITASDVSDYLQIRLKHLSQVQREFARLAN